MSQIQVSLDNYKCTLGKLCTSPSICSGAHCRLINRASVNIPCTNVVILNPAFSVFYASLCRISKIYTLPSICTLTYCKLDSPATGDILCSCIKTRFFRLLCLSVGNVRVCSECRYHVEGGALMSPTNDDYASPLQDQQRHIAPLTSFSMAYKTSAPHGLVGEPDMVSVFSCVDSYVRWM